MAAHFFRVSSAVCAQAQGGVDAEAELARLRGDGERRRAEAAEAPLFFAAPALPSRGNAVLSGPDYCLEAVGHALV